MGRIDDWRRCCELLDDDPAVWSSVRDAIEQGEDPWEALLDGLDDAGALAYLQAEDTGMELSDALLQLPRVHAARPDLDEVTDTDDLAAATRAADAALAAHRLRLVRLLEDEVSWPVVVVPAASVAELEGLVGRLGDRLLVGG